MFTVLGFSLGFMALGAVVAVLEVLATVLVIAFCSYAALALVGVVVFSVIGVRRLVARRRGEQSQPAVTHMADAYHPAGRSS
jgi:membrane protein implicated in regulation of membrane protease activity